MFSNFYGVLFTWYIDLVRLLDLPWPPRACAVLNGTLMNNCTELAGLFLPTGPGYACVQCFLDTSMAESYHRGRLQLQVHPYLPATPCGSCRGRPRVSNLCNRVYAVLPVNEQV